MRKENGDTESKFRLENRTYDRTWLFRLPYACAPFETVCVYAQKLLVGLACVLSVLAEAGLIDAFLALRRGQGDMRRPVGCLSALLLLIICKRMGYALGRRCTLKCQNRVICRLRQEMMKKCGRVSFRLLEDRTFQELKAYIEEQLLNQQIVWRFMQFPGNFLQGCLRILGVYLIIGLKKPILGILLAAVTAAVLYFYAGMVRDTEETQAKRGSRFRQEGYLRSVLCGRDNLQERALFSYTEYLDRQWQACREKASEEYLRKRGGNQLGAAGEEAVLYAALLPAVLCLAAMLAEGDLSLGLFIALIPGLYEVINQTAHSINRNLLETERGILFLEKLTAFANLPEKEGMREEPSEGAVFEELTFSRVSFRYPGTARYVLRDLSFRLERGGRYAFVGANGSGKTTVAKLLTGLYDSYEGSILLNGREMKEYAPGELKAMFGAVFQDSARYEESLAVNLLLGDVRTMGAETPRDTAEMGDAGAAEEKVSARLRESLEDCAAQAGLEELVQSLPNGWDTPLGTLTEESVGLSDGQWQRIFMARLLRNPAPVWIVDEPAAALDPVSESRLYGELSRLSRGRTVLSISHRLGAVKASDCIFVLQDGAILEHGTHEELMANRALYAEMYEKQRAWYAPSIDKEQSFVVC